MQNTTECQSSRGNMGVGFPMPTLYLDLFLFGRTVSGLFFLPHFICLVSFKMLEDDFIFLHSETQCRQQVLDICRVGPVDDDEIEFFKQRKKTQGSSWDPRVRS